MKTPNSQRQTRLRVLVFAAALVAGFSALGAAQYSKSRRNSPIATPHSPNYALVNDKISAKNDAVSAAIAPSVSTKISTESAPKSSSTILKSNLSKRKAATPNISAPAISSPAISSRKTSSPRSSPSVTMVATPTENPITNPTATPNADAKTSEKARRDSYSVVASYAHDAKAFTEGLLWYDGGFFESVGLNGQSEVRRVAFPSGRVLDRRANASAIFGEGLALCDNRLVQLSWTNGRAFLYDRATLKPRGEWKYDGEGWGLTFDGRDFVMSNGSDTLTFRDARTFAPKRTLRVTLDGKALTQLNELEWIDGEIWANVWQTDFIVRIDARTGRVKSYLDLTGLLPLDQRSGREDVLNGIAYDAARHRIFVTGKFWPKLYEISVAK